MSSYSCTYAECVTKKTSQRQAKEERFIPLRVLVCGHSICDLCVLNVCKQQKEFIKCTVCLFNTTITEVIQKMVIQCEPDIKRWLDPNAGTAPEVIRFDTNLFPLDFHQIGSGIHSGVLTATKTAEMIDLDLDDESTPAVQVVVPQTVVNSLFEDDAIVKNVVSRIARTAPEKFRESIETGVKTFIDLSQNHTSIKRSSDDTKEWFKKIRVDSRELFHKMHSILQIREKEFMEEINVTEENRLQELRVEMNEILSKRSELKGKLLQSPQLQTDKDRNSLKKSVDKLIKDANITTIRSPDKEFKFLYETSIESNLKKFGRVDRQKTESSETNSENSKQANNGSDQTAIYVSSDEEEDNDIEDLSKDNERIDKEVVTILTIVSPSKFYVQKCSDKERFDILKEQIQEICYSPYNHSPGFDALKQGEYIFAFSLEQKCWCRASLTYFRYDRNPQTRETLYLADIVLIDYGISETVQWFNIREKKVDLFDERKWPPFAYKCTLYGVKPNRKKGSNWSGSAVDMFNKYVSNTQLVLIDFGTRDGYKSVDLIHYDIPDVTSYRIPSIIEVLSENQEVVLLENIDFSSYCRFKCQSLKYRLPEIPKTLKTMSVLVSHVETPDLFYVQLQKQHQSLLKLIDDINDCYTNENVGIYTYYCPKLNTPCAALFDGDKSFHRALVIQKGKTPFEFVVLFVDFGNKQTVKNLNLRLLKDSFVELPIQAIPCGLIHVDPAFGFKWTENATDGFKYAISNDRGPQILTMCVYESKKFVQSFNLNLEKLLVVLRSYDGDNGIKINELMVRKKFAQSSGMHSRPDVDKSSSHMSSQESLNSLSSSSSVGTVHSKTVLPFKISAHLVLKDLVERFELSNADIRSTLIKVVISYVKSPKEFYVQIDRPEVRDYFETQEKELHKFFSLPSNQFSGDINYEEKEFCAFKLSDNRYWRRGQVIKRLDQLSSTPEEPRYSVIDLDYGSEQEVKVSLMRKITEEFTKDGAFALKCKLYSVRPTGGPEWTQTAKDKFNDFVHKFKDDLYVLVKENVDSEPISVKLYSCQTIIPSAFAKKKIVYESINNRLIRDGLAMNERTEDSEKDDDKELNTEPKRELKTQMPFAIYSSTESILGSLQQRLKDPHKVGQYFEYLKEEYPKEQSFFGVGTDLKVMINKEGVKDGYYISFRYWFEGVVYQPSQIIEKHIQDVLNEKGELDQFVGPYTTGAACTAYFEFDKTWNRAEIIGVIKSDYNQNQMCVRFVDYGNQESILVDKLSSEVFGKETPKLALNCQLINIKAKNTEADKEIRNIIYTKVLDHKCRYYWENYPKLPMKVTVELCGDNEKYVPFLEILDLKGLIVNRHEENESIEEILNINPKINEIFGLYPMVFQTDRFYEVVMSYYVSADYAFFQATELKQPEGEDFTINKEHDNFLEMLFNMREEIKHFMSVRNFNKGHHCVAKYVDECWYRGLIMSADYSTRTAQVFFVDHGNIDPISFDCIRELPKTYCKPKAHAFLCQIYNIKPPKDQMWSRSVELAEKLMVRLTEVSEQKIFARFQSNEYPLKIDLYVSDPNDQTIPGKHVFQEFVDNGLLEFCDPRDVWHKPIETTRSYKRMIVKSERFDK